MKLDDRTKELIAIGTSVGANCHACLERLVGKAREQGISEHEIAEAIEVGKLVRKGAYGEVNRLASELLGQAPSQRAAADCGCSG